MSDLILICDLEPGSHHLLSTAWNQLPRRLISLFGYHQNMETVAVLSWLSSVLFSQKQMRENLEWKTKQVEASTIRRNKFGVDAGCMMQTGAATSPILLFCVFWCVFSAAAAAAPVIGLRMWGGRFIPIKETTVCCSAAPTEITKRCCSLDGRRNWKL